jgi:glutamate formiminotransferase
MIECVPNVSEGQNHELVDRVARAVRSVPGVSLLDYSADPAHNRSVFTCAGDAASLEHAVVSLYSVVLPAIDLRTHRGVHPRLGAVDVVPFVPLEGSTMADCVSLAQRVGRTVAERFQIPVFLYEEAASAPDRRSLSNVRRGGFEKLADRMAAGFLPDFGPHVPHPTAGASAVGARTLLVAFNVNLSTRRVDVAGAIARAVRSSNGGLPCVKALGLSLDDRAIVQVSMNLTDHHRTSIRQAFEAVAREAAARGVDVIESEIIGLAPAAALDEATATAIRLPGDWREKILERRLSG